MPVYGRSEYLRSTVLLTTEPARRVRRVAPPSAGPRHGSDGHNAHTGKNLWRDARSSAAAVTAAGATAG